MPRTVIAVDLDTMRELADEETRVRAEKTDWSSVAYREEAVRRVEERRETQKMLEVWEVRRRARLSAIENVAFGAMIDLYQAASCYSFADHSRVGELVTSAHNALAALCDYALKESQE